MLIDITVTIALFVAAQGLFLFFIILITPRQTRLVNSLLAAFIGVITTQILFSYFVYRGLPMPRLAYLFSTLILLEGPILYLYVRALISPRFKLTPVHLVHLLPVAVINILLIWVIHPGQDPAIDEIVASGPSWINGVKVFFSLWFAFYTVAAIYWVVRHEHDIREHFSAIDRLTLDWLRNIMAGALLVSLIHAVGDMLVWASIIEGTVPLGFILALLRDGLLIYLIAYGGYRHHQLFGGDRETSPRAQLADQVEQMRTREAPSTEETAKYQRSTLSRDAAEQLWQLANARLSERELFLKSDLQLTELADAVGVSSRQLSEAINTASGQNFYDFVNGYRARKAAELIYLHADRNRSMLDIALEAGFGNTVTFGKYFKKHFSKTPSQYKKSLKTIK